jgi:hypothetical protein
VALVLGRRSRRSRFREPWLVPLAGLGTLVLLGFVAHRALFLLHADRVQGRVVEVVAQNAQCARKLTYGPCTRFTARVRFARADGSRAELMAHAGSVRGHGQPLRRSWYEPGDALPIVYDPALPAKVYVDDASDLWSAPFVLSVGVGTAWLLALFGRW